MKYRSTVNVVILVIPKFAPMHPACAAVIGFILLAVLFGAIWLVQLRTRNAGLIDPIWSVALGFLAVLYGVLGTGDTPSRLLVATSGGIWGLRLGAHLGLRNHRQPEDRRYRRLREK